MPATSGPGVAPRARAQLAFLSNEVRAASAARARAGSSDFWRAFRAATTSGARGEPGAIAPRARGGGPGGILGAPGGGGVLQGFDQGRDRLGGRRPGPAQQIAE